MNRLWAEGAEISAYDPTVVQPLLGIDIVADPYSACRGADVLVLLTEWPEFAKADLIKVGELMAYSKRFSKFPTELFQFVNTLTTAWRLLCQASRARTSLMAAGEDVAGEEEPVPGRGVNRGRLAPPCAAVGVLRFGGHPGKEFAETSAVVKIVFADGLGTSQGRCLKCGWRSCWYRKESLALRDAQEHTHEFDGTRTVQRSSGPAGPRIR